MTGSYRSGPDSISPLRTHFSQQQISEVGKSHNTDMEYPRDRSQREQSVLSGMSIEDMEAAETLNSLHKEFHSPKVKQAPPKHVQITSSYPSDQLEPLLSLVTSQYPLAGAVINGSLSAYKTTQSYIPGAEWTERNVGLPIAGTMARISGVEGGLRWALQPRKDVKQQPNQPPATPDIEKGLTEANLAGSELSLTDTLPAYNATDRSPPYEQQTVRQAPAGWRQQLVISTSGLGIAMSEESLRSLRYCLSWLRWANGRLGGAVQSLKDLVEQWSKDESSQPSDRQPNGMTRDEAEGRQAVLSARIAALKAEVLQTLKQVVGVVSTYAGGALPENARNLVHRHLISLPQRFSIASAQSTTDGANASDAACSAHKVMVLAQEGLDMMTQVSRVVNDTLVSAESWCDKLGRRNGQAQQQAAPPLLDKSEINDQTGSTGVVSHEIDIDVKMEM